MSLGIRSKRSLVPRFDSSADDEDAERGQNLTHRLVKNLCERQREVSLEARSMLLGGRL
jgi:hypothetical protein